MSTPSLSYLALDGDNDPVFDNTATLHGAQAVAQAVLTNLRLFYGEWWENLSLGLPVFQQMLGQLGDTRTLETAKRLIQQTIESTPYVVAVTNILVEFKDGQLSFSADINTAFGPTTVSSLPGAEAYLG